MQFCVSHLLSPTLEYRSISVLLRGLVGICFAVAVFGFGIAVLVLVLDRVRVSATLGQTEFPVISNRGENSHLTATGLLHQLFQEQFLRELS